MQSSYEGRGEFGWDLDKAKNNLRKHRVSFEEALSAFQDLYSLTIVDTFHSEQEERLILIGMSDRQRLLVVSHMEREGGIRIISARLAVSYERKEYEEEPGYGI